MILSVSTPSTDGELTVNRTAYPADEDYAVQIFLADSRSTLYLTVAQARLLGDRLLAATTGDAVQVPA